MPLIHDEFTAANVVGYYNATKKGTDATLGEKFFPAKKQRGLKLSFIKGKAGRPIVLRASAFDTPTTFRDRLSVELSTEEMPFFKEGYLVKEADRAEFITMEMTGNQALIDTVKKTIYDDKANLIYGAHARLEAMRMQVLATGTIAIESNGQFYDYDYGVDEANKGKVAIAWGSQGYDPIGDLEKAKNAIEEEGGIAEVMILNAKTYGLIRSAASTVSRIKPLATTGATVTNAELDQHLRDNYGLIPQIKNDTFVDDDGTTKRFFPDNRVTLAPNRRIGHTVFGTTPVELDLVSGGNTKVEIVDTGIAVLQETKSDPVNTMTSVSMIALPSAEYIDQVFMLNVAPEVGDTEPELD